MPNQTIDRDELASMRTAFRKILALSSSAGKTITNRDALEVIRALAAQHIAERPVVGALRRHVERVREILGGVPSDRAANEVFRG
jgi:hypothetical protein